jgi:hypothetical protein
MFYYNRHFAKKVKHVLPATGRTAVLGVEMRAKNNGKA